MAGAVVLVDKQDTYNFRVGLQCHISRNGRRMVRTRWYHRAWLWFRNLFRRKYTVISVDHETGTIVLR